MKSSSPVVHIPQEADNADDTVIVSTFSKNHDFESSFLPDDDEGRNCHGAALESLLDSTSDEPYCAAFFFVGFVAGAVSSTIGYGLLMILHSTNNNTSLDQNQLLTCVLTWSICTTLMCYGVFRYTKDMATMMWSYCTPSYIENNQLDNIHEIAFAIGVFIGYCSGCITIDVMNGIPWTNTLRIMFVAVSWAVLILCITRRINRDVPDDISTMISDGYAYARIL